MSFLTVPLPLVISATAFLLLNASRNGDRETLNSLIGKAEDTKSFARCLCLAAENGHLECVKTLASFTEPKMFFGWGGASKINRHNQGVRVCSHLWAPEELAFFCISIHCYGLTTHGFCKFICV